MLQNLDRKRVRKAFDRAADTYDEAAVLQKEVCSRLLEKLDVVKLKPEWILDAGSGTGEAIKPLQKRYKKADVALLDLSERMLEKAAKNTGFFKKVYAVCGDLESNPFGDKQFDLVFSSLALQWCNDIGAALAELKRVIKPGGLLMFATFGPDTLKELRASWKKVDQGAHVNAFIDMHDIGDALMQIGFAEPVMEAEVITVNYNSVDLLMQDLRNIGANVTSSGQNSGMLTPNKLDSLRVAYDEFRVDNILPASYEIIYGHAWVVESDQPSEQGSVNVMLSR